MKMCFGIKKKIRNRKKMSSENQRRRKQSLRLGLEFTFDRQKILFHPIQDV